MLVRWRVQLFTSVCPECGLIAYTRCCRKCRSLEHRMLVREEGSLTCQRKRYSAPPPLQIAPNKRHAAVFHTEKGGFTLELFAKQAPYPVHNFLYVTTHP
jgi:hypothetical protein